MVINFTTELGSKYVFDAGMGSSIRNKKCDDGSFKQQPQSSFTGFITQQMFEELKRQFKPNSLAASFGLYYECLPKKGLLPLEIFQSSDRVRVFKKEYIGGGMEQECIVHFYHPRFWFNGKDFHIGHEIIDVSIDGISNNTLKLLGKK